MKYYEKATLFFLANTYISIILLGIFAKCNNLDIMSHKETIKMPSRKSLYLMKSMFHLIRIHVTFKVIYHKELEYSFAVNFLNLYFIVLNTAILFDKKVFCPYTILILLAHIVYAIVSYHVFRRIKRENLIKFLRAVSCDVSKRRMYLVHKRLQPQRYLLISIIIIRNISLLIYVNKTDNFLFLFSVTLDYFLTKLEKYEIRITKLISLFIWITSAVYTVHLARYGGGIKAEYLFIIRATLYIGLMCVHIIYNSLDLLFYGNGINKILV